MNKCNNNNQFPMEEFILFPETTELADAPPLLPVSSDSIFENLTCLDESDAFPSPPITNSPQSSFSPSTPFSNPTFSPEMASFNASMIMDSCTANVEMFPTLNASVMPEMGWDLNLLDANMLAVPALFSCSATPKPAPTPAEPAAPVSVEIPPKKKPGRKRKERPSDPEAVIAEQNIKRARNTEAARRSRIRRMARHADMENNLHRLMGLEVVWAKKQTDYEDTIASMEKKMKMMESKLIAAGIDF